MSKMRVTKNTTFIANDTSTVHYEAGWEGTAPNDHIDKLVASGFAERIDEQQSDKAQQQQPAASASHQ